MIKPRFHMTALLLSGLSLLLAGCSDLGYYLQCAGGHMQVMARSRPIDKLLADGAIAPELRQRLELAVEIRDFASHELGLPDNASYRSYADVERPFVVWNVVAAPEFSIKPVTWCFPVAGCVPYRGYFKAERAQAFAARLREQGHEVSVYGVAAYSTLNWFNDPILNTFNNRRDMDLAALIFHELAHQQVYIKNDAAFNEAFATTVELVGVERWLAARGRPEAIAAYREEFRRTEEFVQLQLRARARLGELYGSGLDEDAMRAGKEEIFALFRDEVRQLRERWGGFKGFDRWLEVPLNNAHFISAGTYRALVPAFRQLLAQHQGDLRAFYAAVDAMGRLSREQRDEMLAQLLESGQLRLAQQ